MPYNQTNSPTYQIPIDSLPLNVAVYRYDGDDFVFIDFNKQAEITENMNKEHLLGKKLCAVFPAVKEFGLYDVLLRVHESGVAESFEKGFYQDNRISGWRKNEIIALPNGDIMAVYEDLTKIKQIEQESNKHKQQLEEAHKAAHLGSWMWDIKTNIIEWSDEVFQIFGESAQSFTPTFDKFLSYLSKEDQEKLQHAVENSLKTREPYQYEHTIVAKDGTITYVQERGSAHYNDLGEPEMMIGAILDITEYKTVTNELQSLGIIVDNIINELYIFDAESLYFTYVNKAALKNIGYTLEELKQMRAADIKPHYSIETFSSLLEPMLHGTQDNLSFETTHRRKDGSYYFVTSKLQLMEVGNKKQFVVITEDSTERKKNEQAVHDAEEIYHTMFNLSPFGILLIDPKSGKAVEFNTTAHEELGYSAEEFAQLHVNEYEAKESAKEVEAHIEALMNGSRELFETKHKTKSGETRDVSVSVELIKIKKESYFFTFYHDITAMKLYEEQLKTLTMRLSLATQAASIGVWEWDIKENTLKWDDQMYTLYGIHKNKDENKISYMIWKNAVVPSDIAKAEEQLQNAVRGEGEYNLQFWITTPEDEKRFIQAMGVVEHDEKGEATRFVGVNWDITKQKLYEQELESAKISAEAANIAKSNFLANMSHEIRTPMNAILGMIQLAQTLGLSPELREYMNKIDKSSHLLLHIINDILDFSKIEANKLDIVNTPFDLNETVEQISALFGSKADAKGLEFVIHVAPKVPLRLLGDNLRLSQILNNLVSNAIKFTHAGTIEMFISDVSKSSDKVVLKFGIKDSGIGITQKDQSKLFNMFTQADESITRKYGGTGLGLSISKRLVELMGGTLEFSSQFGEGSTFEFTIAFGYVDEQNYLDQNSPLGSKLSVLVVDDQISSRDVVREIFLSWKCKIDEAQSGHEAIEKIKERMKNKKPYDLIIVDWNMPELNGIETIKAIRSLEQDEEASQIIMMATAYSKDIVLKNKEDEKLIDIFLNKPVVYSSLYDALSNKGLSKKIEIDRTHERENILATAQSIRGASVLLVEDNEINIQVQTEFLNQMGLQVTTVTDGLQAVELLKSKSFDAVLMDYQMPIMDGVEATKVIRKSGNSVPIIAMTAAAMEGDKSACMQAGMNDYISKPIDFLKMVHVIAKWIEPNFKKDVMESAKMKESITHAVLPEKIDGIDMNEGLQNSAENPTLYHNILIRFFDNYAQGCEPLKALLAHQETEEVKRWVHTLKGLSATIGALNLSSIVRDIELKLENNLDIELDALCHELKRLHKALNSLEKNKIAVNTPFNYALAIEQIDSISQKLANSQLIEQEQSNNLKEALGAHADAKCWISLQNALENFDYERAEIELGKLLELIEGKK